jgi:hypothetical protein
MAHETHESGKRDACPDHIGAEGVSETMRVCLGNRAQAAVMTKYRAKTGRCERRASVRPLKHEEEKWRARLGPFEAKIAVDDLDGLWIKWQESLAVSFSANEHLSLGETKVLDL